LTVGVNFTAYQELKKLVTTLQPDVVELPSYQHMMIGLISGAMGPFSNAPIDTIKTRELPFIPQAMFAFVILICKGLQRAPAQAGQSALERITNITYDMWRTEGYKAFYKGITPRVLRVAPGQAIVFAVYERVSKAIERLQSSRRF
jgi:solute carrier family 25 (mitochondrial citrate transporter), member 1